MEKLQQNIKAKKWQGRLLSSRWKDEELCKDGCFSWLSGCSALAQSKNLHRHDAALNLLTPDIKEHTLLSCPFIMYCGEVIKISRKSTLGDHILNSHDLRARISIDIARRNLMLIIVVL